MDLISNNYLPGDHRLIEQIVRELKSQGIFDQFRKECISDVDTKPAYQNLRQRVESSVSGFLTKQTWNPEMNKNQVREMLRKNIYECGFLETGVERIVDQVVNPKITTVFLTKVEDVVYKFLGIEKPIKVEENVVAPIKINSYHDLLPTDLEAISPEMPEEKDMEIKDEIEDVKMEEESPSYEMLNEKKEKLLHEDNSVDSSQSSVLSGLISNDSNPSQKQDSLMSLNSSESRMSLMIYENTSKIEGEDVFLSQKSSESASKVDLQMNEKVNSVNQDAKKEFVENHNYVEQNTNPNDVILEKTEELNSKLKDHINKKRERHHSSSERSKSKSDKEKDKTRSDKYKKDERETSKEQKIEKEKYRIPKLSDKTKTDKIGKSKEKDNKSREKSDKEVKTDRDKKSDKDKKSSKHSSERDRSKSDSKIKKDIKSDKKEKDKDDKREKKDSSKNEKPKEERKSSSSSKKKESSSSKERYKDKDCKKSNEESHEKSKNGHGSSTSSSTKRDSSSSKYKKDEDKSRSSRKKDDKDDRKKKKTSKDDHYSSKEKKNGRRSSDRDSDGPSNCKILPTTPQKNLENYSQKPKQDSSHSALENSTDDTGTKDNMEEMNEESDTLQLEMQKIKLPKFASNLQEAMKIMKIRKQLKKLENTNKLNLENLEVKKLLEDIAELSKDGKKEKKIESADNEKLVETSQLETNEDSTKSLTIDINDFISSSNISMAKWNALEAKFMEEMGCIDYDSYESPYLDDDELMPVGENTNFEKIEKILDKVKNEEQESNEGNCEKISDRNEDAGQIEQTYLTEDKGVLINEIEINSLITDGEVIATTEMVISEENIEETVLNMQDAVHNSEVVVENIEVAETEYLDETDHNIEAHVETSEQIARNFEETVDCVEEIVKSMEENVDILDAAVVNIELAVENVTQIVDEIKGTDYNIDKINQNTTVDAEKPEETIEHTEQTMEFFNNKNRQLRGTIQYNREQSRQIGDNEKLSHLSHATFDPKEYNELNLANIVSKQPDYVLKSVELEEIQYQNELPSDLTKFSELHSTGDEKSAYLIKKIAKLEDCRRKAIVLLEKHSLTEELIKIKQNGKHVSQDSLHDNLRGDMCLKVLETEKENIEVNKIITVEKSNGPDTQSSLENEAKHVGNLDKNHVVNQDDVQNIQNSVDYIEETPCQNVGVLATDACDQNLIANLTVEAVTHALCSGTKIFDTAYRKSSDAEKNSTLLGTNSDKVEDDDGDPCLGFEVPDNGRNLTILKCLIKNFEDNVCESIEQIRQFNLAKERKITPHSRKRKIKQDKSDISNNNLEITGFKRRRTHISSNTLVTMKLKPTQEKGVVITDIALENKFSLPLSPAESESSSEKREEADVVGRKGQRSVKFTRSSGKKSEEFDATSAIKTFKSPPKNSSGKKGTRQRYTSEDLYKPRIFLRRTRNGPNNS